MRMIAKVVVQFVVVGIASIAIGVGPMAAAQEVGDTIRPAYNAERGWYPADAGALKKQVDDLLARAKPTKLGGRPA
ncbi:MAG: hypothetical protein V3U39_10470, partial [Acidimicrobiia bacterium]